jgi:hypothetical protein
MPDKSENMLDFDDVRAYIDARLQQAVLDKVASLSPEELAEWEAEEEQLILYGNGEGPKARGVIHVKREQDA